MLLISSPQNPRVKSALALLSSRGRKKQNRFLVFGEREVTRLLVSEFEIDEVFIKSDPAIEALPSASLTQWGTANPRKVIGLRSELFAKFAFGDRQDTVLATVQRPPLSVANFRLTKGFYLVVDGIEKPGNLGAVFRSADGAGVAGVLISDPLTDVFHPNSIRTSMGTVFSLPFSIGTSGEVRRILNEKGFGIHVARPQADLRYTEVDFKKNTAVVLGNESQGVGAEWSDEKSIGLPMLGIADSLNVSNTAAILSYEYRRQADT